MKPWKPIHFLAGLFWLNLIAVGWADMLGKINHVSAGIYLVAFLLLAFVTSSMAYEKGGSK